MSNALARLIQRVLELFRSTKQPQQLSGETSRSTLFNADYFLRNPGPVVYLIQYGDWPIYKIGHTTDINTRLNRIRLHMPHPVHLIHCINTNDPKWLEVKWHGALAHKRRIGSGIGRASEWFDLTDEDVEKFKRHAYWDNPDVGSTPQLKLFVDEAPHKPKPQEVAGSITGREANLQPSPQPLPATIRLSDQMKEDAVDRVSYYFDTMIKAHPQLKARLLGSRNWEISQLETEIARWRVDGCTETQALAKWEERARRAAEAKLK